MADRFVCAPVKGSHQILSAPKRDEGRTAAGRSGVEEGGLAHCVYWAFRMSGE